MVYKQIVVVIVQPYEYTKYHLILYFKWVNYRSVFKKAVTCEGIHLFKM